MNKKGDKLLSFWWLFVLMIVGGGVVIGVGLFYSAEVDVRDVEAEILNDKILDCIIEEGFLVEGFSNDFDIFEKCKISSKVFSENGFYFKILFEGEETFEIKKGTSFETECEAVEDNEVKAKYFPECVKRIRSVVYLDKKGELEVLTASNQVGRKVNE